MTITKLVERSGEVFLRRRNLSFAMKEKRVHPKEDDGGRIAGEQLQKAGSWEPAGICRVEPEGEKSYLHCNKVVDCGEKITWMS